MKYTEGQNWKNISQEFAQTPPVHNAFTASDPFINKGSTPYIVAT
jgi:hypothetical protein